MTQRELSGRRVCRAFVTGLLALLACCDGPAVDDAVAPEPPRDWSAFNGDFEGTVEGQPVGLLLRVIADGECRGVLTAGKGTSSVSGRAEDGVVRGRIRTDAVSSSFVIRPDGTGLQLAWVRDGELLQVSLSRELPVAAGTGPVPEPVTQPVAETEPAKEPEPAQPTADPPPAAAAEEPPPAPQIQRDPYLVGRWSVSIVHGRLKHVVTTYVNAWLTADGKYQWGGSQSLITLRPDVGTPATDMVEAADVVTGEWMTANSILYYKPVGQTTWNVAGRYGKGGGAVIVYPADGSPKQLWERP